MYTSHNPSDRKLSVKSHGKTAMSFETRYFCNRTGVMQPRTLRKRTLSSTDRVRETTDVLIVVAVVGKAKGDSNIAGSGRGVT